MFGAVFDTEADSLNPTKFHVLSACVDPEEKDFSVSSTHDYGKMVEFLTSEPILVAHNAARWDIPNLERVLEFSLPKETLLVDSLFLSWYLFPKRRYHGLEDWGEELGVSKPEIDDWENLTQEEYRHRCEEDVKINTLLWKLQYKYLRKLYGTDQKIKDFLRYLSFKAKCARLQEESRWKLDIEKAEENLSVLEKIKEEKYEELGRSLPKIPKTTEVKPPSKPYKADGTPSAAGIKWRALLREQGLPYDHMEPVVRIDGYDEPNPGSHKQVKDWLFSLGWEPETFKTNKKGVEVPQINKLKQDGGGVCPSVLRLKDKDPAIEVLDNFYVVTHRISILEGFLRDHEDGYLSARIQGLTNTLRFKHSEIVNLPKIDAAYGDMIRGVLTCEDDEELCGSDMSSLEDRTKQHFMFDHDPEYVKEMMTPDFDPHLDIAVIAGLMDKADSDFYKEFSKKLEQESKGQLGPEVLKSSDKARYKLLKTVRGIAKNTNYAGVYGAGPPRIAKTAGISVEEAKEIHKKYWERNWSVKAVAEKLRVKTIDEQMWLFNPVSEFWYTLRNEKDRFSTLNQGTGVFCFDTWLSFVIQKREQLTGQFHDEGIWCIKKGHRDQMSKILEEAIKETNEVLSLNRELGIDIQFGQNYAEIH